MLIREHLESGSISEARSAVETLLETGSGRPGEGDRRLLLRHLVRKAVTIALDHDNRAKERVAQLLSALHPLVIDRCAARAHLHLPQLLSPPSARQECHRGHRHPSVPKLSPSLEMHCDSRWKEEPRARQTASKIDVTILSWQSAKRRDVVCDPLGEMVNRCG